MSRTHTIEPYLLNPTHRITVNLIGLGGTGSQVLSGLYRLNEALIGIGHPGIHVRAWDPDIVSEANIGRQLFSPADTGYNKAVVLITRINRYAGYDWTAMPTVYSEKTVKADQRANITISCVDSLDARRQVYATLKAPHRGEPWHAPLYWLDYGNLHKTGQCLLGTVGTLEKRMAKDRVLKHVFAKWPKLRRKKDKDTGPSCSLAQALGRQDLYINSTLAQYGLTILWNLFREGRIRHHGCYVNLTTLRTNPIEV